LCLSSAATPSRSRLADYDCLMDLSSLESVRIFAEKFAKEVPRLDILINNAGVMRIPTFTLTVDGYETHFQVNYLSHFLLTLILTPLLLKTSKRNGGVPSRVINVSAELANVWIKSTPKMSDFPPSPKDYGPTMGYCQSKLLQFYHSTELLRRYYVGRKPEEPKIFACSLHPGVIHTNLSRNESPWLRSAFFFVSKFVSYLTKSFPIISLEDGAKNTVRCATMKDLPVFNLEKGDDLFLYYMDFKVKPIEPQFRSLKLAQEIWEASEKKWIHPAPKKSSL
jgi:NAD(P)-dependent dehydrogenase (short-subunit alcohol dehydrogenase family)